MAEIPTGAVTFLFSDIEGSTRLVKQLRDRYGSVLADHQRLLRAAFSAHGGYEVDTQGDSFFIAFASAEEALLAAVEGQLHSCRTLARGEWRSRCGWVCTGAGGRGRRALHRPRRASGRADRRRRSRRANPRLAGDADPPRGRGGGPARLPPGPRRAAPQGPRSARSPLSGGG